jgi:hypothetical protein
MVHAYHLVMSRLCRLRQREMTLEASPAMKPTWKMKSMITVLTKPKLQSMGWRASCERAELCYPSSNAS